MLIKKSAVLAHPCMLSSPEGIAQVEAACNMRCKRAGALVVRMVPIMDAYEQTDRDSWLGNQNEYKPVAA